MQIILRYHKLPQQQKIEITTWNSKFVKKIFAVNVKKFLNFIDSNDESKNYCNETSV